MAKRYKIRFPDADSLEASRALETPEAQVPVVNDKRNYYSVVLVAGAHDSIDAAEPAFDQHVEKLMSNYGATVVEDYQYELDQSKDDVFDPETFEADDAANPSLDDVIAMIKADQSWEFSRGGDSIIAVVDTGIDGNRPEFPAWKKYGSWEPAGDTPWTDWEGHGSMCACIAAGTRSDGGAFNGVAPDAKLIACKTRFFDSELAAIYDYLTDLVEKEEGLRLIATNSFGRKTGVPPQDPANSDFIDALDDAIGAGITVFFSAGNNHQRAGGDPAKCDPNSVWLHKSRADIMAVATCKLDQTMWYYSSRGPGQKFGDPNTNKKPDVTAPTPAHGRVVYGGSIQSLPNGWGTSGACPQAAGLGALLKTRDYTLGSLDIFKIIRKSAVSMGHAHECEGYGLLDCYAALSSVAPKTP